MSDWTRVSKSHPCPICRKSDWCGVAPDGTVCCMRVQSDRPSPNGGSFHQGPARPLAAPPRHRAPDAYEAPDFDADRWWQTVRHVATADKLQPWADRLGLPVECIDWMGACTLGPTLAFPMCDGTGRICGIRTRSLEGSKKSVTGSRSGVFLPTIHMEDLMPIICEGPTDAAAAMALGFEPIGRPSCSGSERHVIDTCRRLGHTRVTLCADADGPGISGARKLSDLLRAARIGVRLVTPSGHKDLRDWWRAGTSRETVEQAWSQAEWR